MANDKLFKGFDISQIQGNNINFKQLKNTGTDFVIFRNYVGNDFKDQNCEKNIVAAKDAGLAVGIYNFLYPIAKLDPLIQAQLHWANSNKSIIAHCIDLEWPDPSAWSKPPYYDNGQQINDWSLKYLAEYKRISGLDPIVYTFPFFCSQLKPKSDFSQYRLWIASYANSPTIPKPWTDYVLWQNSGGTSAKLPNGSPVDTDLCPDLSIFGSISTAPAIVSPIVPEITTTPIQPTIIVPPVDAAKPIEVAPGVDLPITLPKFDLSKLLSIGKSILTWMFHFKKPTL